VRRCAAPLSLIAWLLSVSTNAFAQSDTAAPEILAFTLVPTAVDASAEDAELEWCATARDAGSGLGRAVVFIPDTAGSTPTRDEIHFSAESLEETVCGTLTLARGTPKGVYDVQLFVEDRMQNSADYVSGDAFGHGEDRPETASGGVRLLCPIGPCKVVNKP
jgi:hypothetical protein